MGKMGQVSAVVWHIFSPWSRARGQQQYCRRTPPQFPVDAGRPLWTHPTAPWWAAVPQGTAVTKTPRERLGNASWLQADTSDLRNKNVFSTDCGYVTQNFRAKELSYVVLSQMQQITLLDMFVTIFQYNFRKYQLCFSKSAVFWNSPFPIAA